MEPASGDTGGTDAQSFTDIQSYLANFNKEIDPSSQAIFLTSGGDGSQAGNIAVSFASQDQLFSAAPSGIDVHTPLDQNLLSSETPQQQPQQTMLIQGPDGQPMQVLASGALPTSISGGAITTMSSSSNPQLVAIQSQGSSQPQLVAVQNPSQLMTSADGGEGSEGQQQSVVLNTGNSYQTVTIVPSEVNQGGEVSYVLIVSQPEDEKNADMSVYDFKEEKGMVDSEEEEDGEDDEESTTGASSRKVTKATARKYGGVVQTQLMCNYCNYTSPKRYLLTRHMKTHSEERPHKCHICDRGFKTVASLQNHINTHTGVRPHKCKECDAAFTTSGELVRHVRYRHTFEKPHKCSECDYSSVELSKLKRHMRSHTGERPYQCPHCSYASPDTYKLKRHLRIHTGEKPYECDICRARFTQSNSLKAHRLIHSGAKPIYQCELCPTTCGRKTDLKIHVQKLHTADVPLQCKKCGKSFPDRYTYKIHTKTHEGEKCFKCELCPYAALSQRHLESHILTHTGEKPFDCDECDQSFRQKQLLKRHKNLYHTPDYVAPAPKDKMHECGECHKTFAHKGNLLRHMAIHDPDNPLYSEEGMLMQMNEAPEEEDEDEEEEEMNEDVNNSVVTSIDSGTGQHVRYIQDADGNYVQLVNADGTQTGQILVQFDGQQQIMSTMQLASTMEGGQMIQTQENGETVLIVPQGAAGTSQPSDMMIAPDGQMLRRPQIVSEPHIIIRGNEGDDQAQLVTEDMVEVLQQQDERPSDEGLSPDTPMLQVHSQRKSPRKQKLVPEPEEEKKKNIETCFGFGDLETS